MKCLLILAVGLTVSGCAAQSSHEPPVVDLTGIDANKYNQDQSECMGRAKDWGFGAPITDCMREKGYKILVPKS